MKAQFAPATMLALGAALALATRAQARGPVAQAASPAPVATTAASAAPTAMPTPIDAARALVAAPLPKDAALIFNTGSTNIAGYAIALRPDGSATVATGTQTKHATLDAASTTHFFRLLSASVPLEAMQTGHCMKSASFGSSTFVTYGGVQSPDLSCGGDAAVEALAQSIAAMVTSLDIKPQNRMRPFNPRAM